MSLCVSLLERLHKIYEKVGIMLAFCGVVLPIAVSGFDFSIVNTLLGTSLQSMDLYKLIYALSGGCAFALLMRSCTRYLDLLKVREISIVDFSDIREEEIYLYSQEDAALWLVDKYIAASEKIQEVTTKKQIEFEKELKYTITAVLLYAASMIIKGVLV